MSREIDALVAVHVKGYEVIRSNDGVIYEQVVYSTSGTSGRELPHYSTDIKDAWEVVDKLKSEFFVRVGHDNCEFERREYKGEPDTFFAVSTDHTPAMAICICALKAKGVEIES